MNKAESKYFNTATRIDEAFISLLDKKEFEYITIKEICQKAGVNRSTFYLHYETLEDLLSECNQYVVNKFTEFVKQKEITSKDMSKMPVEELNFITPKYLMPWLEFIKTNKTLFRTYLNKFSTLTIERNNKLLFNNVLNPVLERFEVKASDKLYMLKFYIEGIMALVKYWVSCDCKEEVAHICELIISCVKYGQS